MLFENQKGKYRFEGGGGEAPYPLDPANMLIDDLSVIG